MQNILPYPASVWVPRSKCPEMIVVQNPTACVSMQNCSETEKLNIVSN